jgi:hypothetical protein
MREVATLASAQHDIAPLAAQLVAVVARLERVTMTLVAGAAELEPARALANASAYLELVSRTVVAWVWLKQASVASHALTLHVTAEDDAFYRGKVLAARYWFGWELTKTAPLADLLERGDAVPYEMQDAWF